jgi:hypothetical protein
MSTNSKANRMTQQTADQKLIDGLKKHETTVSSLVIGGASFKTADIIGILQARIDARDAAVATKATWQTGVKADQEERAKTKTVVSGLRQALQVAFAGSIDALADFGLKPRKPRVVTPEQKQAAAAKAKATRAARHTMGSKQKKSVKGNVTSVAATPPTSTPPTAVSVGGATPPATSAAATPHAP